jgi:hypothetical protein
MSSDDVVHLVHELPLNVMLSLRRAEPAEPQLIELARNESNMSISSKKVRIQLINAKKY